jgi:hypothetical protein
MSSTTVSRFFSKPKNENDASCCASYGSVMGWPSCVIQTPLMVAMSSHGSIASEIEQTGCSQSNIARTSSEWKRMIEMVSPDLTGMGRRSSWCATFLQGGYSNNLTRSIKKLSSVSDNRSFLDIREEQLETRQNSDSSSFSRNALKDRTCAAVEKRPFAVKD